MKLSNKLVVIILNETGHTADQLFFNNHWYLQTEDYPGKIGTPFDLKILDPSFGEGKDIVIQPANPSVFQFSKILPDVLLFIHHYFLNGVTLWWKKLGHIG